MSQDRQDDLMAGAVISRRSLLSSFGVLALAATVGSSLLLPDEAEAGKKKRKKRSHGKKIRKVTRKKHKKNHGKRVSKVARKKRKKKRY